MNVHMDYSLHGISPPAGCATSRPTIAIFSQKTNIYRHTEGIKMSQPRNYGKLCAAHAQDHVAVELVS